MISTITRPYPWGQPHPSDFQTSQNSNKAGVPLPIIPRRATRSQSMPTSQSSGKRPAISLPSDRWGSIPIDSDSSSSNSSESSRRKRVGEVRDSTSSPPRPISVLSSPQHSASSTCPRRNAQRAFNSESKNGPTFAAPRPLVYTPGMLHSSVETMRSHMLANSRHNPRSVLENGSKSAPPEGNGSHEESRFIRKKRPQPIKSSLKSSRCARGSLSVVTMGSSSKSEPPTPKVVHFDPQLEHVKLFLAEQKPLAVSRDGSPAEDTSGTDSDFPSFIYGDGSDTYRSRRGFVMQPINLISNPSANVNVALEDFYLNSDGTTVLGNVRVRNIAFVKIVAVRFTFDSWQTTSEVTAHYVESFDHHYDRFSFSIRLNDLLPKMEGKTLVMAVRYNVAGQEFWDNNHHQNYAAIFTKAKAPRETKKFDNEDASDVENLRSRLERVALHGKEDTDDSAAVQKSPMRRSEETPPSLKSVFALSSRYDFETSLRDNVQRPTDISSWVSSHQDTRSLSLPSGHTRSSTYPIYPDSVRCAEKAFPPKHSTTLPAILPPSNGQLPIPISPRDSNEERLVIAPRFPDKSDNTGPFDRGRNHRRGSSADARLMELTSAVRKTSPGTPISRPFYLPTTSASLSRYHSSSSLVTHNDNTFSQPDPSDPDHIREPPYIGQRPPPAPTLEHLHQGLSSSLGESSGDSELSTPSLSTPTSSRSPTPSPTISFKKSTLLPSSNDEFYSGSNQDTSYPMQLASPGTHYRNFLNK